MRAALLLLACLAAGLACASASHICNSGYKKFYEPNARGTYGNPSVDGVVARAIARGMTAKGCKVISSTKYEACANPTAASTRARFAGDLAFGALVKARCPQYRYPTQWMMLAEVEVARAGTFKTLVMDITPYQAQ